MNLHNCLITLLCLLLSCNKGDARNVPGLVWDAPRTICEGGYARIHPLADGSLMLTYTLSGTCYVRTSSDGGSSWGDPVTVMEAFDYSGIRIRCVNSEFAQLRSGRIIFAANLRPQDSKSSIFPFSIAIAISDDGGVTWSERRAIYEPPLWDEDVSKGAWEPFVMELPDGRVQVYFTDNTPHYISGDKRGNNISYVESTDGGDTWSKETIVCHTPGGWDGMPVVAQLGGRLYLAVEHKDKRGSAYPMEIKIRSTGPEGTWDGDSVCVGDEGIYCGAPYIIRTDNYFVVSCQSARGSDTPLEDKHAVPAVWFGSQPDRLIRADDAMTINQARYSGLWNSLCPLDGDSFFLLTQHRGSVVLIKGTIR